MSAGIENVVAVVGMVVWFGGTIYLYLRARSKQIEYLRHFERDIHSSLPVDDPFVAATSFSATRDITRVMRTRQEDPTLEALRREMWHRFHIQIVWIFVAPAALFAIVVTLGMTLPH